MVPDYADCSDLWVFGYGSLIFNPVIDHVDRVKRVFSAITAGSACGHGLAAAHRTARGWCLRLIVVAAALALPSS
jgi:hypothetical protein